MPRYCKVAFPVKTRKIFTYHAGEFADRLSVGRRVIAPFGARELTGFVVDLSDESDNDVSVSEIRGIKRLVDKEPLLDRRVLALAAWMSGYYCAGLGQTLNLILASSLHPPRRPEAEMELQQGLLPSVSELAPTPEQEQVIAGLTDLLRSGEHRGALLQGVSASGKTEVYLQVAARAIAEGGQALILVPEIALTPQVERWAGERFGGRAAVLHSRLTPGEHYRLLCKAKEGKVALIIGTRSAVFTPFVRLRLIVVDEEFDHSYKETRAPRYHAGAVALKRAELERALIILGSATPSLEAYQAVREGRFTRFSLTGRVGGQPLPRVLLSDLKAGVARGRNPLVSSRLRSLLEERLLKGEQAIIAVNRRGMATYLFCRSCGYLFCCSRCEVVMVYHHTTREFYCHYCNQTQTPPETCPACRRDKPARRSEGSGAVVKELTRLFPAVRISRLDSRGLSWDKMVKELEDFRLRKTQILVGSRMVTKGHHFPGVTLVAVLGWDKILNRPDFRAAERAFQGLFQAAGRAGRSLPGAEVFIETGFPEHYAITALADNDPESFYQQELGYREELGYPPFGFLANLIFSGKREEAVRRKAEAWYKLLEEPGRANEVELLGPAACYHKKMRGVYRWHLMLKTSLAGRLQAVLGELPDKKFMESGVTIDIDPSDLF